MYAGSTRSRNEGRTAVITGAALGLGWEYARRSSFARRRARRLSVLGFAHENQHAGGCRLNLDCEG